MRKFIRDIWVFTLLAVLFYSFAIVIINDSELEPLKKNIMTESKGGYGNMRCRLMDVEQIENIDLLILGSSHAYRTFDTRIFDLHGIRAFNLGSSSQTPIQTEMLVKRYFDKLKPKKVIFEVNPGPFMIDGVESALDILYNIPSTDYSLFEMSSRINQIKVWNSFIYYTMKNIKDVESICISENSGIDNYIQSGGFVERELSFYKPKLQKPRELTLLRSQRKAFERTLNYISKYESEVLLIRSPLTDDVYNSFTRNKEVDKYFKSQGNYLNLQHKVPLEDTIHFFDSHHLNQYGAEKVTKVVIELLEGDPMSESH